MKTFRATLLVVGLAVLAGACAPRTVTKITGNSKQVKFIYYQKKLIGSETGVVQCKTGKYNYVENCADMAVQFVD